ncbi:MAG: NADH-quinone oxidoreductase subunit NuoN [Actinomycetota bacterium]|nr:NADH-quinone oxidoreductase subunit NuoN [Actinomycetota bacterium]
MTHTAGALLAAEFTAPSVEYRPLSPILIVLGVAVVGVLIEAFAPRAARYAAQLVLSLLGLVAAFVAVVLNAKERDIAVGGAVALDGVTYFLQGTILLLSVLGLLLIAERSLDVGGDAFAAQASTLPGSERERSVTSAGITQTEVFPLMMFSIGGMLIFPAANDLLTMFVGLEVLSFPLYLLCGMARRRRLLSQEAAVKYFLLGSFSSAFLIYGIALVYGYAGSVVLGDVAEAVSSGGGSDTLLFAGVALVAVGLLFKVGAVPFHSWTPDVYQGAPTPVTGFMAAATKVAAFGALLRVFYVAFGGLAWDWQPLMWVVAILTMVVGTVLALTQTDIKRMLAYSSIAHAGFVLTGVVATDAVNNGIHAGVSGVLFYLLAYGFATVGAFAVVTLVRDSAGEATHLSQWAGLGRRSPLVAGVFTFFLLAFAGIPLTSGFMGKYYVFFAAWDSGAWFLTVAGLLTSAVAAFFYVRVIVLMYFSEPAADGPSVAVPSALTTVAVALGFAVTVVLGVWPTPFLELANDASVLVR